MVGPVTGMGWVGSAGAGEPPQAVRIRPVQARKITKSLNLPIIFLLLFISPYHIIRIFSEKWIESSGYGSVS
jgi:hypothetical protein